MKHSIKNSLMALTARAAALNALIPRPDLQGCDFEGKAVALNAFFQQLLDAGPAGDKATCEQYEEAWAAARSGDRKPLAALCEVRKIQINNYIKAQSNWASLFFETINLQNNESAEFVNETSQEVAIGYLAQDGKPRLQRAIASQEHTLIPLRFVGSEKVGYQLEDIQRGNIADAAKATFNIGFDLSFKMDMNARTLMTAALGSGGCYGAFVTTGTASLRTYHAHSGVVTANLPATNELAPSGNGAATKFRLAAVRTVIKYCDQWANVFTDGALRPTGLLIVPSIDSGDLLDELSATAAKASAIAEGLLSNYTQFEFGGQRWIVVPDATLASGIFYPVLNKPVGTQFLKSSMDKELVKTDEENNWEERSNKKVQGLYIPVAKRVNACRVTYKSS